ncbi:MAG: putative baseplate assembly protein [Gammaproteobacteria bacterium]
MSLPALQLDDLTWTEMVESIRARIVAHSNGEWTAHGPADTGVALLELFAYRFEQRIYWLDQVPPALSRAALALLDDAPLPTRPARTVLQYETTPGVVPQNVPSGHELESRLAGQASTITTVEPVTVLPVADTVSASGRTRQHLSLSAGGKDRTEDLRHHRGVELLPIDGSPGECQLTVWLDRAIDPTEHGGGFNLLMDFDTPVNVLPEWNELPNDSRWFERTPDTGYRQPLEHAIPDTCGMTPSQLAKKLPPGRVDDGTDFHAYLGNIDERWAMHFLRVAAPSPLRWWYSTGAVSRREFRDTIGDGTAGLRRSGVVRLPIADDWKPIASPAAGPIPYRLFVTCDRCNYSSPPLLKHVAANVAHAVQLQTISPGTAELETQVANWLPLPFQTLALSASEPAPLKHIATLELLEPEGWQHWLPTDDFYRHGPQDRVFVIDRERKELVLGDGLNGRIPRLAGAAAGTDRVKLCYLAGGGAGNPGTLRWQAADGSRAMNVVALSGGRDAETIAQATARAGQDLQRVERAVLGDDYEALALSTPGIAVARAHAAVGFHPDFPCQLLPGVTTVFVLPEVPRRDATRVHADEVATPVIDPGALREVALRLNARRMLGQEVHVRPAQFTRTRILVEITGAGLDEAAARVAVTAQLSRFVDPLIGGVHGTGWPFGEPLRPSTLLNQAAIALTSGGRVQRVAVAVDHAEYEDCKDVAIGDHALVALDAVDARFDRVTITEVGLR